MPITIDLNKQAKSIASQPTNTPEGLKLAVFNNFAIAVNQLAKKSSLSYSLDAPTLQRVLNTYLEQHPTHNNPINIVLHETKKQAEARFYDLNYRFEGMPAKPTLFNKTPEQVPVQCQGKFNHIAALGRPALVNGKIIHRNGEAQDGQFQYIPALKRMELVEGTKTAADGTTTQGQWAYRPSLDRMDTVQETGRRAFIPELGRDALVDGKITFGFGEVQEGQFQYIPELKGTYLVDGKITLTDGHVTEGKMQHIPELKGVYLVDGKVTFTNGNVNEGKCQYIPELNAVHLVDGKTTYPNGKVSEGKWQYIPELKGVYLVDGKVTLSSGEVQEGKFQYIPEMGMWLVDGKTTFANRNVYEGKFQYIPERKGVYLVNGKKTYLDGRVEEGHWTFNPITRNMSMLSEMACQLQGWVGAGDATENRNGAVQRMELAYNNLSIMLGLDDLNLKTLPDTIHQLLQLEILDLSNNALTTLPPSIGQLPLLENLSLRNNPHLTELPAELFNLPQLQSLDLSGCQSLRYLPAGFERLSAQARVNLERTGLSANVLEAAARAVELERAQSDGQRGPQVQFSLPAQATREVMSLGGEMLEWFKEENPNVRTSAESLNRGLLQNLNADSAQALAKLLMRLRKTGQYTFAPQAMAKRVVALLTGLMNQPNLLETFCAMALESTETCDDRTALGMLNMELALLENQALNTAMRSTTPKRTTFQQLLNLGKGVFKQRTLMEIAHQHAQRAEGYVDETEVVLKYMTHLGTDLQLPVRWDRMLYERFAFQVTDTDLAQARTQLEHAVNLDHPEFLSFICNWHPFQATLQHLEPKVVEQIESDLRIIKRGVEIKQERLFEEYEQISAQHGAESPEALNLVTTMNQNTAKVNQHAQAIWHNALAWCLEQTDNLQAREAILVEALFSISDLH